MPIDHKGRTIDMKHVRYDSGHIEDTDAEVLKHVLKCCELMAECKDGEVFIRRPLTIERGLKRFEGGVYAIVTMRLTLIETFEQTAAR